MKNTVLGIIKKTVGGMTRAAATAAWQGVTTTVGQLKSTLVTAAKAVLGPLCEQEPKIVIKVQAAIIDKIQPPIQKLTGDVAAKIFSVVLEPISLFYVCAVKGFTQVNTSPCASPYLPIPPQSRITPRNAPSSLTLAPSTHDYHRRR